MKNIDRLYRLLTDTDDTTNLATAWLIRELLQSEREYAIEYRDRLEIALIDVDSLIDDLAPLTNFGLVETRKAPNVPFLNALSLLLTEINI